MNSLELLRVFIHFATQKMNKNQSIGATFLKKIVKVDGFYFKENIHSCMGLIVINYPAYPLTSSG